MKSSKRYDIARVSIGDREIMKTCKNCIYEDHNMWDNDDKNPCLCCNGYSNLKLKHSTSYYIEKLIYDTKRQYPEFDTHQWILTISDDVYVDLMTEFELYVASYFEKGCENLLIDGIKTKLVHDRTRYIRMELVITSPEHLEFMFRDSEEKCKEIINNKLENTDNFYYVPARGCGKTSQLLDWMKELSNGTITFCSNETWKEIINDMYGLRNHKFEIEKVIFNKPATIVFWSDGTKTVVKAQKKEKFDKEKGLAMAIAKKMYGTNDSQSDYYDIFKKWCGGK